MSTTPQQIITNALTLLPGILFPGSTPSTTMSNDGLVKLNDMLASWTIDRLFIFATAVNDWNLVSGTNSYTIGATGVFAGSRPISIIAAHIIVPSSGVRFPMKLITVEEWNAISDRSAGSVTPKLLYNDGAYPLSTLSLWPTPNAASIQLELFTWQQLTQFTTLLDTFDFPPGYERAITYALAMELASVYRTQPTQDVVMIAETAKASLKGLNAPPTRIPGAAEESVAGAQITQAQMPAPQSPAQG